MFVFSYLSHFQSLLFKIIHNSNYPVCFKLEIRKKKMCSLSDIMGHLELLLFITSIGWFVRIFLKLRFKIYMLSGT